eukprot:2641081-Pyramimonas_sp.AAC.1
MASPRGSPSAKGAMSDDRRSNQQSPQQPAGGAAVSVAGDDIGLSVDLAELMQTDPVKAKWQLQVHKAPSTFWP